MLVTVVSLSRIAGVTVECPTKWALATHAEALSENHGGYFDWDRHVIGLRSDVCHTLRELPTIPPELILPTAYDVAGFSLFILAHEMQHANGIRDEAQADCGAARTFIQIAAKFGIGRRIATLLAAASRPLDGYNPAAITACWPRSP